MNGDEIVAARAELSALLIAWGAPKSHEKARDLLDALLVRGWKPGGQPTPTGPRREQACVHTGRFLSVCDCGDCRSTPDAPAPAERTKHYLGVIRASIRTQEEA